MKKSELKRLVLEALQGYSKYAPGGVTKGGTTDDFRNILTTIARTVPSEEDSEEEKARRGNAILDKANPKNVDRIIRGEEPIYENTINFDEKELQEKYPRLFLHYSPQGPNEGKIKAAIKRNLTKEEFEGIIAFLEEKGYTVDRSKSIDEFEYDDDRYWYPTIVFGSLTEV